MVHVLAVLEPGDRLHGVALVLACEHGGAAEVDGLRGGLHGGLQRRGHGQHRLNRLTWFVCELYFSCYIFIVVTFVFIKSIKRRILNSESI